MTLEEMHNKTQDDLIKILNDEITELDSEIGHFNKRYMERMNEENIVMANSIVVIVEMYRKEVDNARNKRNQILTSRPSANKRVFTLKD